MCFKTEGQKGVHETVGSPRPSGWSAIKKQPRRDDANAHIEYIQQLFNKPIKLFFCAREIYFVFLPEIIKTSPRAENVKSIDIWLVVDSIKIQYCLSLAPSRRSIQFEFFSCDKFYSKFRLNYSLHLIPIDSRLG
jgi:hypothetical protein